MLLLSSSSRIQTQLFPLPFDFAMLNLKSWQNVKFLGGFGSLHKTRVEAVGMDETSKEEFVGKEEKENHGLDFEEYMNLQVLNYLFS